MLTIFLARLLAISPAMDAAAFSAAINLCDFSLPAVSDYQPNMSIITSNTSHQLILKTSYNRGSLYLLLKPNFKNLGLKKRTGVKPKLSRNIK